MRGTLAHEREAAYIISSASDDCGMKEEASIRFTRADGAN
jgi:hypothetical protein